MPTPRTTVAFVGGVLAGTTLLAGCAAGTIEPLTVSSPTAGHTATEPGGGGPTSSEPTPFGPSEPMPPSGPSEAPPTADGRAVVAPFITYAGPGQQPGTVEVDGIVTGVVEEGGTCTATVRGTAVTASASAVADATTTTCGTITLQVPPAGQTVVLSYSSSTSQGVSDPAAVTS